MSNEALHSPKKKAILDYVENFIDKRDGELRATLGDDFVPSSSGIKREAIVIKTTDDSHDDNLGSRSSLSSDLDTAELNFDSDPVIETREGEEQVYKQQVYVHQYQPPTPEPVDIQVQEVIIQSQTQRPPIHVHVRSGSDRDGQRTPSPIVIKSAPPPVPPTVSSTTNEPVVFNKYIPVDHKQSSQQIIIHRHPEMPPKPRPIVVEQWLPGKPAPKRITYRRANLDDFVQTETERQKNRYIEYTKPQAKIEVEIVRLPVVKINPEQYQSQLSQHVELEKTRDIKQNYDPIQWRI